jgi:hypothetical protein
MFLGLAACFSSWALKGSVPDCIGAEAALAPMGATAKFVLAPDVLCTSVGVASLSSDGLNHTRMAKPVTPKASTARLALAFDFIHPIFNLPFN